MRAVNLGGVEAALSRLQGGEALPPAVLDALAADARALLRRVERLRSLDPEAAASVSLHPLLETLARSGALPPAPRMTPSPQALLATA